VAAGRAGGPPHALLSLPLGALAAAQQLRDALQDTQQPWPPGAAQAAAEAAAAACTERLLAAAVVPRLAGGLQLLGGGPAAAAAAGEGAWGGACGLLLVAAGGTATTASALLQRLPAYEPRLVHRSAVTRQQLEGLAAEVATGEGQQRWAGGAGACAPGPRCSAAAWSSRLPGGLAGSKLALPC
jgi:hypothetical protein